MLVRLLLVLMYNAHSGGEVHDYYWNGHREDTFDVSGVGELSSGEFGNFIAGFAAGYEDAPLAYWIVRGAGSVYGIIAGLQGVAPYGEWQYWGDDESSVRNINLGTWWGRDRLHDLLKREHRGPAVCP